MPRSRLLIALASLLVVAGLDAATVRRVDDAALVARAERIVEARVEKTRVLEEDGVILTDVSVVVIRSLKGSDAGARWSFRVPGGELGDRGMKVPGMPRFAVDDELLLFLTAATHRGIRLPVGLGQGCWRLAADARTGRRVARPDLGGAEILDEDGHEVAGPGARDLTRFLERIERLVVAAAAAAETLEEEGER